MNKTNDYIVSFNNLVFYPMTAPNAGCIASGKLSSGYDITVTGGNTNQHANGVDNYLVEVSDSRGRYKDEPRVVTKRNMELGELALLIEHHYKNRNKRMRR